MSSELMQQRILLYWLTVRHFARVKYLLWALLCLAAAALLNYYSAPLGRHIAPLQEINIQGGNPGNRAAAEKLLQEVHGANLIGLDIRQWQQKLQALPGVSRAQLKRQLPHTLQVQLESSRPLARWTDGSLIDTEGKRYIGSVDKTLPVFRGNIAQAAEIAAFYRAADRLLPGEIAQVELDARGGWQVFLSDGLLLRLGRRALPQLHRYAAHAAALNSRLPALRAVDMRYTHGFAVQVHTERREQ